MKETDQLEILAGYSESFSERILMMFPESKGLLASGLKTIQINMGRLCNQSCKHCHVEASPMRTEVMTRETVDKCLKIISDVGEIETVDITGGAPEMNENFAYLVSESKKLGKHVIDRCNLTILETPGYEHLDDFLYQNEVELVASMPHFNKISIDKIRGAGIYNKSISVLKKLNQLGYGSELPLNLVYNPSGLFLSGSQSQLEREFKENLGDKLGIYFNNLYCINNFPIGRFLGALMRVGKFESYMDTLVAAYNQDTIDGLMCRNQMSVGYDGNIYDCDFNQMLDLNARPVTHVDNFDYQAFISRNIRVANHCFACTAGGGSSCGGEIEN
jgi:radical SAM/Cys-rich protein